jgi:hypothetical protein
MLLRRSTNTKLAAILPHCNALGMMESTCGYSYGTLLGFYEMELEVCMPLHWKGQNLKRVYIYVSNVDTD